jgi:hypothetical protein
MKWGQVLEKFTSTGSIYVYPAGVWRFFWYPPHTGANIRISSTQQNQKETMEREEVKYDQCATCLPLRESHIVSNILSKVCHSIAATETPHVPLKTLKDTLMWS